MRFVDDLSDRLTGRMETCFATLEDHWHDTQFVDFGHRRLVLQKPELCLYNIVQSCKVSNPKAGMRLRYSH